MKNAKHETAAAAAVVDAVDTKANQMDMAKNIARLTTKKAKQHQAHMLCESLKRSIRSK
jgi:hypothetical protein